MHENQMIGVCGLKCYECSAFLMTRKTDEKIKNVAKKPAEAWSKVLNIEIKPQEY
ncbi:MAG: hypothetical protein ACTSSP_12695 [Candidatus Asgardarchaeia archaeon]